MRRLADAALRREDRDDPREAVSSVDAASALWTCWMPVDQVVAVERHRQHAVDAVVRVDLDRVLGDGQDDHRHAEARLVDLLDELQALDPALEQRVDDDDVRAQLADWAGTLLPSLTTSSSLMGCWAFSSPRMYCATCGTSSTTSRRIWSADAIGPTLPRDRARRPAAMVLRARREGHGNPP